jgi:hypothetical protein
MNTTTTTATRRSTAPAPSRARRNVASGILPWIGTILFVSHAAALVTQQPDGWQQKVVQVGVVYLPDGVRRQLRDQQHCDPLQRLRRARMPVPRLARLGLTTSGPEPARRRR